MKLPVVLMNRKARDILFAENAQLRETVRVQTEHIADLKTILSETRHEKHPVRCPICGQFQAAMHYCGGRA